MGDDFYFGQLTNHVFNKSAEAKVDRFAYGLCGLNGTYIEIGAHKPHQRSNTSALERLGWRGFGVELDTRLQHLWVDSNRHNPVYWSNAVTFDYVAACREQNLPGRINFLQVDIEPPENTFEALKTVVQQGIEFDFISFEHDKYCQATDLDPVVSAWLADRGYKVAVYNVCARRKRNPGVWSHIETWYVNKDIAFGPIDFFDWIKDYHVR